MVKKEENYKKTEIGLIPEDWEIVRLGDVFEFTAKPRKLKINECDLLPFIPMDFISDEKKQIKGFIWRKAKEITSGSFVFKGDLLIAKITPSFENGKQAILDTLPTDFGYATTEIYALHPFNKRAINETLYFYLKIPKVRKSLSFKMEGTTGRQRLPKHVLKNLLIPLPPLPEQKAIAEVLDKVRNAIEQTEEVIKATKELKKSLTKHLFTYGAVPVDEIDKVKLKETEIGLIPEHWNIEKLGNVANIIMGQSPPSESYNTEGLGVPFLQGKAEFGTKFPKEIKYTTEPKKLSKENSVLLSVRAPVGDVNLSNKVYCIGRGLASIDLKNNNNVYLFYYFLYKKSFIEDLGTGSTFKSISKKHIENLPIPLPPISEQKQIAEILTKVDKKIEAEENKKQALEKLFKSLLNNLMTGKIRVNRNFLEKFKNDETT